jgi:hypothetical protein
MKTRGEFHSFLSHSFDPMGSRAGVGISGVMVALLCGCASDKPMGVTQVDVPPWPGLVMVEPGTIAVVCPREPARFSFDKAVGRSGYSSDGAGSVARACLDPPTPPEPGLDALYSPLGLVMAPFGAAYGAISAGHSKLSTNQVTACETDLARIMGVMADQEQLRNQLLEAAGESTLVRLVPMDSKDRPASNKDSVNPVLETRIEELRLERTGTKDTSFVLRIKARALLHRSSDGKVVYDLPCEYRSGQALFLDWTYPKAFRAVAETGYQELAKHIAERLLVVEPQGPVLVGAGYKTLPGRARTAPAMLAMRRPPTDAALTMRVSYPDNDVGNLDVYPAPALTYISLQKPLTRDEAVSEAMSEVDWSLDGLQNSRNLAVQLSACVAAIPMSLWKQTVAMVEGVSQKQIQSAEEQLAAAARGTHPQLEMANLVAGHLNSLTSQQPVLLARNPAPAGTPGGSTRSGTATSAFVRQGDDTALEVRVRSAGLRGERGVNPSLALCVEAEATVFRASDGAKVFSCPVHYRGEERKFTQWAAHDARLFRRELQQCYRQVSNAIVDRLAAQGLITPDRAPHPTLAKD